MSQLETLKKHIAAVHSSGELGLLERKLLNVLLLNAYDDLLTKRQHTISVDVLRRATGFTSRSTAQLRDALTALVTTALTYNVLQHDSDNLNARGAAAERWTVTALLASGSIADGVCTYEYSQEMAKRLFDPEMYTRINLAVQKQFRSSFALNLYENCLRFKKVSTTGSWDIGKFRRLMGATSPNYEQFRRLNEKVIKPAVLECNKYSDIYITPEFIRTKGKGSPVIAVKFLIADNPQKSLFPTTEDENATLRELTGYKALRALQCSDRLALNAVMQGNDYALQIAGYTNERKKSGKIKTTAGAYAAHLINAKVEPESLVTTPAPQPTPPPTQRQKAEQIAQQRDNLRRLLERERTQKAMAQVDHRKIRELADQFIADRSTNENEALPQWVETAGRFKGIHQAVFEAFIANTVFGKLTDTEIDARLQEERASHKSSAQRA